MPRLKKYNQRFLLTVICMSFALFGCDFSNQLDVKVLNVQYAKLDGKCLLNSEWAPVQGEKLYWAITNNSGATLRSHQSEKIEQVVEKAANAKYINDPYAKAIFWATPPSFSHDKTRLEIFQSKYKDPNLKLAKFGYLVSESALSDVNGWLSDKVFDPLGSREFYVPAGYSACNINYTWIMKETKADFTTSFWSGYKIIKDETISIRKPEKSEATFAEELLQNFYSSKF